MSFNYLGELDGSFEGGLFSPAAEPSGAAQSPRQRRPHALAVSLLVVSGRLWVDWGHSADLCDHGTIERLAAAYAASLRELIAHCRAAGTAYAPGDFTYADPEADDLANRHLAGTYRHPSDLRERGASSPNGWHPSALQEAVAGGVAPAVRR